MLIPLGVLGGGSSLNWISGLTSPIRTESVDVDSDNNATSLAVKSSGILTVKQNNIGEVLWQKEYAEADIYNDASIRTDATGNTYIRSTLETTPFTGLIYKLQPDSTISWQKQIAESTRTIEFMDLAIDQSTSDLYVSGMRTTTSESGLLCKIDSSGAIQWSRSSTTVNNFRKVAVDASSNIYAFGHNSTSNKAYLTKWSSTGSLTWTREISSPELDPQIYRIVTDASGNIYIAAQNESNSSKVIVLKYNTSGTLQWSKNLDVGISAAPGIDIDSSGNVYIVCNYVSSDPTDIDAYLIKLDSTGATSWIRVIGSTGFTTSRDLRIDSSDSIVLCCRFEALDDHNIIRYPSDGSITGNFSFSNTTVTITSASVGNSSASVTSSTVTGNSSSITLTASNLSNSLDTTNFTQTIEYL